MRIWIQDSRILVTANNNIRVLRSLGEPVLVGIHISAVAHLVQGGDLEESLAVLIKEDEL